MTMSNPLISKDWSNLISAMADVSYHGRRVVDNKLKLSVVLKGLRQGVIISDHEGKVLHEEIHIVVEALNESFYRSAVRGIGHKKSQTIDWLTGYTDSAKNKIFHELRSEFFRSVAEEIPSRNIIWDCPDIPTFVKWSKVLGFKFQG